MEEHLTPRSRGINTYISRLELFWIVR
jgi:hypothetical protein